MPFPSREIEAAYHESLSIVQGSFKDDPGLYAAYCEQQPLFMKIADHVSGDVLGEIRELIEDIRQVGEYERRHSFTEGWLMAQKFVHEKSGLTT